MVWTPNAHAHTHTVQMEQEHLTGDGSGVVWRVGPQVLSGLGGRLRETLWASAVTHTDTEERKHDAGDQTAEIKWKKQNTDLAFVI